jgi:hypothetical protein
MSELKKVRVRVPVTRDVEYIVHVKDPGNLAEVADALESKDPSDWETDPCFYEHLGDVWKNVVNKVTKENIDILED